MPTLENGSCNIIRAALLFGADKYRKAADLGARVFNATIEDEALQNMRSLQRISASLPELPRDDVPLALAMIDAIVDESNRQMQRLLMRGAVQDAALFEHRLRELYAARAQLATYAPALAS